ncbi:Hydroxymethylglutaryl-CoA synthase [Fructilactobacillus florum 8D]|uniref:Hydroxymethylglutaryl-CoA synthase n=1 Tax=Fructilactobacillus florum 8D TaxID=1221538 RepID=W9EMR7_9LACO|nr:hydroxymethylglutaryl-CoA synthase [Fructilactobacillus florum]EKK20254.1 Hydroxymethylglutaryl-CoA synthase [Fructilactobacillus florum 2F]ETO40939.1 Hydroxymethylglutaryl-CoA synthase [Fructilactobacillus florum 8D]
MDVGIDRMGFYTPSYKVAMADLAQARGEDPAKYLIGIGQTSQAVIPPSQDAVTMAANAALQVLDEENRSKISLIIFGTESGVDNSKSGAIYLQKLLHLNSAARAFEIKQACYGATAGLQMAQDFVRAHPEQQALVVGSDVARYGLYTPGEVTQGAGAVAMIVKANPTILALSTCSSVYSEDVMDFWRPLNRTEAMVDGHYSNDVYQQFFVKTVHEYLRQTGLSLNELQALVFHLPYTKMGLKALKRLLPEVSEAQQQKWLAAFNASSLASREVGNLYTGSLYLSLLSLLDHSDSLQPGAQIGLFSYGSGAQGEFYTGTLQPGFRNQMRSQLIEQMLEQRTQLSVHQYEIMFSQWPSAGTENLVVDTQHDQSDFVFTGIVDYKRQYVQQSVS